MRITVRHLEVFRAVAQCGSFSLAAQRQHLTQPSLSATIKNLELLCGARLFDRGTRSATLTPIGEELLTLAERVLGEFERSMRELEDYVGSRRGQVRVAAMPALFSTVLPAILMRYREQRPGITLDLRDMSSEDALSSLRRGRVDMAMVTPFEHSDDLDCVPLLEHAIVLMMRPDDPFACEAPADLDWRDALAHPIVTLFPRGHMGRLCGAALAEHGLALPRAHEAENLLAAMGWVQAGLARAAVSSLSAQSVAACGFVHRRLANPTVSRQVSLVTRRGHSLSPPAQFLADSIVAAHAG